MESLTDIRARLDHAVAMGVDHITRAQAEDGHWEDFSLPVGKSDAWVTAYVALALLEVRYGSVARIASASAQRAARWLAVTRAYQAGWGYNAVTGPDTDSTAYSLLVLRGAGFRTAKVDVEWLRRRLRPDGGFGTYDDENAWGITHPDVTPVAFAALPPSDRAAVYPSFMNYSMCIRMKDGMWPSYWWRTNYYSTYWNLFILRTHGWSEKVIPVVDPMRDNSTIHSAFDLAWVLGIVMLGMGSTEVAGAIARELFTLQADSGEWRGAANLRVTSPNCYRPWEAPIGVLYEDVRGLITTATAVRMLAALEQRLSTVAAAG